MRSRLSIGLLVAVAAAFAADPAKAGLPAAERVTLDALLVRSHKDTKTQRAKLFFVSWCLCG